MVYGIILNQGEDFQSLIELPGADGGGNSPPGHQEAEPGGPGPDPGSGWRSLKLPSPGRRTQLEAVFQADNNFHDAVSALCQNSLVDKINRVVRILTYAVRHDTVETMLTTGRSQELLQAHWRIYEVLCDKTEANLEEIIHNTYFLDANPA